MLAKDKEHGVCPLTCGMILMRLWGGCCLDADTRALACKECGKLQICAGLKVGIEGNVHAVCAIWPESSRWTHDCRKGIEQSNLFKQFVAIEQVLTTQETEEVASTQEVPEEEEEE